MIIEDRVCTIEHFDEIKFSLTELWITKLINPNGNFNNWRVTSNGKYDRLKKYKENKKTTLLKGYDSEGDILAGRQIETFQLFDIDVSHIFKNLYELDTIPRELMFKQVYKPEDKIFVLPGNFVKSRKKYLLPHEIELLLGEMIIENAFDENLVVQHVL